MKTLTLVLSETVAVEEARALESTGGPLARVLSAYVAYVLTVSFWLAKVKQCSELEDFTSEVGKRDLSRRLVS